MTAKEWIGTLRGIRFKYPKSIVKKNAIGISEITIKFAEQKALAC